MPLLFDHLGSRNGQNIIIIIIIIIDHQSRITLSTPIKPNRTF